MRINSNVAALNAHRVLGKNSSKLEQALERLSSGKQINRASDNAAGLAISQKMEAQIQGLRQASRNSLDGVSLIQTGEGALEEVHSMLQRMRELSVQGANDIYEESDLESIYDELKELTKEIEKIGKNTDFNGIKILAGEAGEAGEDEKLLNLQVGSNEGENIKLDLNDFEINRNKLGVKGDKDGKKEGEWIDEGDKIKWNFVSIGNLVGLNEKDEDDHKSALRDANNDNKLSSERYGNAISVYDRAIREVSSKRSKFGAIQNRLESTIANLDNTAENLTGAKSRIEDLDMALEMTNFTKLNILQQSGISMLSEANNLPQSMLQLLQG